MIAEGPAASGFAGLPGSIGLSLRHWSGGERHYSRFQFHDGQIVNVTSLPEPNPYATSFGGPSRAVWAPKQFGDLYIPSEGPYQKSPDGRYLAAGAHVLIPGYGSSTWYRRANLIIVDLSNDEIVARIDSRDEWGVHAIAWSPGGQYVAIVRKQSRWGGCHLEKIAHGFGHPVPIDSLYLDVVDRAGNVVASADLAIEFGSLGGEVIWLEEPVADESGDRKANQ